LYDATGLATAVMALLVTVVLVAPITICYFLITHLESNRAYAGCIGVLMGFTLIFSLRMIAFSNAKRQEILAATTA
jgi:hypothetical protein